MVSISDIKIKYLKKNIYCNLRLSQFFLKHQFNIKIEGIIKKECAL